MTTVHNHHDPTVAKTHATLCRTCMLEVSEKHRKRLASLLSCENTVACTVFHSCLSGTSARRPCISDRHVDTQVVVEKTNNESRDRRETSHRGRQKIAHPTPKVKSDYSQASSAASRVQLQEETAGKSPTLANCEELDP